MGMLAAIELAERMRSGELTVEEAVTRHLSSGFVKPIHDGWIPVCVSIIERVRAGDSDLSYKIHVPGKPDDVFFTAETIIEDLHLDPFVSDEEDS